jgi:hypothetical protein
MTPNLHKEKKMKRSKQSKEPRAAIHVEASPRKESVLAARAAIMDILNTERAGDAAKVAACETLAKLSAVGPFSISNNRISG